MQFHSCSRVSVPMVFLRIPLPVVPATRGSFKFLIVCYFLWYISRPILGPWKSYGFNPSTAPSRGYSSSFIALSSLLSSHLLFLHTPKLKIIKL